MNSKLENSKFITKLDPLVNTLSDEEKNFVISEKLRNELNILTQGKGLKERSQYTSDVARTTSRESNGADNVIQCDGIKVYQK